MISLQANMACMSMGLRSPQGQDSKCIPARDTVAGEALFRFSGSKMAFIWGVIRMRSPFASVSTCQHSTKSRPLWIETGYLT